jgi:hypothetical protein
MNREFLKTIGITEEQIDKIMTEHGKTLNSVKKKLEEKEQETTLLSEKVSTFEKQNKDTEKLLKDNEDLKKQYETLQNNSKLELETRDKKISEIITTGLLKDELTEMGAAYPDLLIKNINYENVIVKDGQIINKETVLNPLKDTYKDLFKTKTVEGNPNPVNNNLPNQISQPSTRKQQLIEQYNQAEKNRDIISMQNINLQIKNLKE